MGASFCKSATVNDDELIKGSDTSAGCQRAVSAELASIIENHPYLRPTGKEPHPHPLLFWVDRCRERLAKGQSTEAGACLERVIAALSREQAQQADAFRRFDVDSSGKLDASEFRLMCAYIGWGEEEAKMMDVDSDGFVRLDEFQAFVGHMGGLQQLFERRRQRVAAKQWGTSAPAVIEVGSRVRSYFYTEDGRKSGTWREAQVLALNVKGERGPTDGVLLAFGFGADDKGARQVVPPSWIFNDAKDSAVVLALREVGILDDQQAFWASIFPQSEMRAVECLVPCQREALANVRASATELHQKALPEVRERFTKLGYGEGELHAVLGWIQDLAPMVIHVHLDNVGRFLETDEFYRNQFETKTSCGALDDDNQTRKDWERELFGRAYEGAKPFDRCKYGALSVMNDFRGVTSAYGYGDSYLVLKDVRLRATFAPEDSGGMEASRLAVLDQYAHVLQEYTDNEVRLLVEVAVANTSLAPPPQVQAQLLRGKACDPALDWVTMGFPGLQQRRGKLLFEVELFEDACSPQVGILSAEFAIGCTDKSHTGVGDDKHGWACDGQHSMLWHDGRQLPWAGFWPSKDKKLVSRTVVGIAVDLDERQIWFGSEGKWDEAPAFTSDDVPNGLALYPAISLRGRAAFNFGPTFTHPLLSGFMAWPKAPESKVRVDCPLVGNDELMCGYKEIQIHGEVSLKRNVQRLVANRKYLEFAKQRRSWAVNVSGTGLSDGCYSRAGMRNGMPLYKSSGDKSIYWNDQAKRWHLVTGDSPEDLCASAPSNESKELPREGWVVPEERRGVVAAEVLQAALEGGGMPKERCQQLVEPLADAQGLVFRTGKAESFEAAWQKLSDPPMSAEAAWALAVEMVKSRLLAECGVKGVVVETPHPYEARSHSWKKEVNFEGATALSVFFASTCRTYDSCAEFNIHEGTAVGASAGIGARVQFETFGDEDDCEQMRGTVCGKMNAGVWKVRIDRSDLENSETYGQLLDEEEAFDCFALCPEEFKSTEVTYEGSRTMGDEIAGFEVDRTFPLSPVRVKGFKGFGPAQDSGVQAGWFVDVYELLTGISSDEFLELEGEDLGDPPMDFSDVFRDPDAIARRLEAFRGLSDVTLVFTNGFKTKLLPTANVNYSSPVGEEVLRFEEDSLRIEAFKAEGPAQEAGVRVGWCLNAQQSASQSSVPAEQFSDPEALLKLSNVKLVFEPGEVNSSPVFTGSGRSWPQCTVPGSGATLSFSTDGDGADYPDRRWGIFAVVAPQGSGAPTTEQVDSLAGRWAAAVSRAAGVQGSVAVVPEDWDEARLRALCARHGWDFEWMTEDGERRRRIGEQNARSAAARASGYQADSMWWRLEAAATSIKSKLRSGFSSKFKNEKVESEVVQQDLDPELEPIDTKGVQLMGKRSWE